MKVKVVVTQEHIDRGLKNDCGFCPVALALRDVCKKKITPNVGIYIILKTERVIYKIVTPQIVIDFIEQFDNGVKDVLPFTFELGPLSPIFEDFVKDEYKIS